MRIKCTREAHSEAILQPRDYRWGATILPVYDCPKCGWHGQSEISRYVTNNIWHSAKPKSYAEALELVLREDM